MEFHSGMQNELSGNSGKATVTITPSGLTSFEKTGFTFEVNLYPALALPMISANPIPFHGRFQQDRQGTYPKISRRNPMGFRAVLATLLSVLLVYVPVVPAASPAVVGKISTKGRTTVNGTLVPEEATVFAGDRIATDKETAAGLSLPGGDQVFLPSLSAAQIKRIDDQVAVVLERGALAVVNRSAQPVIVEVNGVRVRASGTSGAIYEVAGYGASPEGRARKGPAGGKGTSPPVGGKESATLHPTAPPRTARAEGAGPSRTAELASNTP